MFFRGIFRNFSLIKSKHFWLEIRRSQGFTLMELLVVLAVMGVMMGLIGFSLLGGGGNELGATQRELLVWFKNSCTSTDWKGNEIDSI